MSFKDPMFLVCVLVFIIPELISIPELKSISLTFIISWAQIII